MVKITLDGLEYEAENLNSTAKANVQSLHYVETQLQRLNNELAVLQTAKKAYLDSLRSEIEKSDLEPVAQDFLNDDP